MSTHYPLDEANLAARDAGQDIRADDKVERHAAVDRVFHWVTAISVFVLLGTGLLPVVGIQFAWVEIHWIAGIALTVLVLFHIVRSLIWQHLQTIWVQANDVGELTGKTRPGKYTLAQKLMHLAFTLALVTAVVTGIMMLVKVETPFLQRDPYLFTEHTWGIVHVLHDLSSLLTLTLVIIHVYFGLLPEKRMYLRAMVKGWVTREELKEHHDGDRL
jgi:formate dehydrogenase subunit gamma